MSPVADFGSLVVETDVDRALVDTLRLWMPTYVRRLRVERDVALTLPRTYVNALDEAEFLDNHLPSIIVETVETAEAPDTDGDGRYMAAWRCAISAVLRGRRPAEARGLAALMGGCVRRVVTQQPSLGGFAASVDWTRGGVAAVENDTTNGRYLCAGINEFVVYVDDVLHEGVGPIVPGPVYEDPDPTDPTETYDPLVTVTSVTVDVSGPTGP